MNISFREKSLWISLVSTVLVFGYYLVRALHVRHHPEQTEQLLVTFIGAIMFLVIVQIVLQSYLAIRSRNEADIIDERDKLIELKSIKVAYVILMIGVWLSVVSLLLHQSAIFMLNVIMFFFICAEIVSYILQLVAYKKGV